jgi:hypothetical protein
MSFLIPLIAVLAPCTGPGDRRAELDCEWHEEDSRRLDLQKFTDRAHLRDDAVVAEDLAIGHADHRGVALRSTRLPGIAGYNRARDACMEILFSRISSRHGVPLDVVREYRLRRNRLADAAVIGIFALFYCWVAYVLAGLIIRRLGSDQIIVSTVAIVAVSVVVAWAGMMLGEVWSILTEAIRLGRGHLSYRVGRIPWVQHRLTAFVSGVLAFWLITALRYRTGSPNDSGITEVE